MLDQVLRTCKQNLDSQRYEDALKQAQEALQQLDGADDQLRYAAHYLAGRAAFCLNDHPQARAQYRAAITQDSFKLLAWEGMAELQVASGEVTEAQQTYDQLLRLVLNSGDQPKQREYMWRIAEACDRQGQLRDAEKALKMLLERELSDAQRLEAQCFLADVQYKVEEARLEHDIHQQVQDQERQHGRVVRSMSSMRLVADARVADEQDSEGGLAETLKAITKATMASPRYMRYHEWNLQRHLSRLGNYPPKSQARQDRRIEALKECVRMITTRTGGCCTPFPFEAAIWLLEEQEELFGGQVSSQRNGSYTGGSSPRSSCGVGLPSSHPPSRTVSNPGQLSGMPRRVSSTNQLLSGMPRASNGPLSSLPRSSSNLRLTVNSALPRSSSTVHMPQLLAGAQPLAASPIPSSSFAGSQQPLARSGGSIVPQFGWYRGDSIRGVDREFIYQAMREEEEANSASSLERAASAKQQANGAHRVEEFGRKLAHQFPWSPSAYVAVGLALRRRHMVTPGSPSQLAKRRQIARCLKRGIDAGADSAAGWKALAELQYQNREFQAAYDTAVKGLEWSVRRRRAGHETLSSFALALRLVVAQSLRRLQRLDEAEYNFKVLAGWVTEGESAFNEMSGSPPQSIRQQALRGIAKVQLERGDSKAALHQYERILGKALIGRGPPAEHWAHAEYAWLLFEDGNLEMAKQQLETALHSAQREVMLITDTELADVHYKLGRICWTMGGMAQSDPGQAKAHFEAAAAVESDVQGLALEWLGRWHEEVQQDYAAAQRCYEEALVQNHEGCLAAEALAKLELQGKIKVAPSKSSLVAERLAQRLAARHAEAGSKANSTPIGRVRYEGALERALS